MDNFLQKDYRDLEWEKDNNTTIEKEIKKKRCLHSKKKFDGEWWSINYTIIMSSNKVLWWYKTGEILKKTLNNRMIMNKRRLKLLNKQNNGK